MHGVRGDSGGVSARGPGVSQISAPRARPSPPVFTLGKHSTAGTDVLDADCPAGDVVAARFRGTEVAVKRIFMGPARSFSLSSAFSAIFSPPASGGHSGTHYGMAGL